MSIVKRGTCSSKLVVSESVYNCPDCGYVEMSDHDDLEEKMCPDCNISMILMSSSSHIEDEDEEEEKVEEEDKEEKVEE